MQLQPLPNYSQILAFQIVHKGSDLGGRWSAPWLGGHPPYVLLVRFGEKQTHSSKVALVRHLHMFINIVTCRILVFCLGLGGDSGEEEPEAGWRKSGSMQPRPPANSPSVPVVQSSLYPCTQSSGATRKFLPWLILIHSTLTNALLAIRLQSTLNALLTKSLLSISLFLGSHGRDR